jgi:CheY-like chemotaxis protein
MNDTPAKPVLIVEDYDDDARTLEVVFGQAGVINPLKIVHSAGEAIAYLDGGFPYSDRNQFPLPGVILLDLKLPGMDGFEFLVWLKARPEFNEVLVIAISGLGALPSIRRAYALGADSFLTKPCRQADVENLIQWFPEFWVRAPIPSYSSPPGKPHA